MALLEDHRRESMYPNMQYTKKRAFLMFGASLFLGESYLLELILTTKKTIPI